MPLRSSSPARWPSRVDACRVDTHCASPGLQPIGRHPLPAHQLAGTLPRVDAHRVGTRVLRSSTSRKPLLASSTVGAPSRADAPCVGTHYRASQIGRHCSPVGQLTSSRVLTCIAFRIARSTRFTVCPFTRTTVHVHWHQTIRSRPLVPKPYARVIGIQTIRSRPLVSKPYARVTGFEPYAHSHVYWYLTIHELLRPLVSNCTQYAPASTDSLIRHRSLLLLCGVSSAACVAGSFISGAQLARPHSASGRKALRGFCPDSHSCYVHAVVRSMYITRSSL
ncbi:hypothetical protein V8E55_007408 [Tylopilus felleus]